MRRSATQPLLSVRTLTMRFSRWGQTLDVLKSISFDVSARDWLVVVGHNGSGKSTLLKAIAGMLVPSSGTVEINDRQPHRMGPRQLAKTVFLVQQDPLLGSAPLLTVFENLYAADPEQRANRCSYAAYYSELLHPLGLADRLRQPVKLLSGGERQLLAIAIASLRPAPLILLDEPLAALDPVKAELCIKQIALMHAVGKAVIQVAHDTRLLVNCATRMLTLSSGAIVEDRPLTSHCEAVTAD